MRFPGLASLAIVALHQLGCTCAAHNVIDVGTCAELQQAVDLTASSGDTDAVLTSAAIYCDKWTTFKVMNNRLTLVAQEGGSFPDGQVYAFENVRFLVSSGVLQADVALSFTTGADRLRQEVNGGVLNVAEGGYARFRSDVSITDVSIRSVPDEGSDITSDVWFGGCVYNQGRIRFENYFFASDCATVGGGESAPGNGGGIFNGETGDVVFKGEMEMTDCGTFDNEGNLGGAIYNEGKVIMFNTANFFDNNSAAGGAIDNVGIMKFLKNAFATFRGNRTFDSGSGGGQVSNSGSLNFNGGVLFEDGFTEEAGAAISNSGTVIWGRVCGTNRCWCFCRGASHNSIAACRPHPNELLCKIRKSAVFRNNESNKDGGAISSPAYATFELPEDTVFEGNTLRNSFFGDCANWYQRTSRDNADFVCLFE